MRVAAVMGFSVLAVLKYVRVACVVLYSTENCFLCGSSLPTSFGEPNVFKVLIDADCLFD